MPDATTASSQLRELLDNAQHLALGVLVDDRPYVGQVPFAIWRQRGSLLVHVSALAKHSRGLEEGAAWSGLVSAGGGSSAQDPFQVPRVTFEGKVHRLERSSSDYDEARAVYVSRLATAQGHFALGGFTLIELEVTKGRLVAGFGSTFNLTASHLREP